MDSSTSNDGQDDGVRRRTAAPRLRGGVSPDDEQQKRRRRDGSAARTSRNPWLRLAEEMEREEEQARRANDAAGPSSRPCRHKSCRDRASKKSSSRNRTTVCPVHPHRCVKRRARTVAPAVGYEPDYFDDAADMRNWLEDRDRPRRQPDAGREQPRSRSRYPVRGADDGPIPAGSTVSMIDKQLRRLEKRRNQLIRQAELDGQAPESRPRRPRRRERDRQQFQTPEEIVQQMQRPSGWARQCQSSVPFRRRSTTSTAIDRRPQRIRVPYR